MASPKKEFFSIRQVIEITGLSEFTLRGWENRYQAFNPQRTDTGRRLYSLQDIEKARLLDELSHHGHKIKDIAPLSLKELKKLVPQNLASNMAPKTNTDDFIKTVMDQAQLFLWDEIKQLLDKKRHRTKSEHFVMETIMPLASYMGYLVGEHQFTVAQEHILSALLKEQLVLIRTGATKKKLKSRLLITTPEGDLHDMGIGVSATLSSEYGAPTLYLGPSTPKADLCESCIRYNGTHILLSSTISEKEGAKESLYSYINFLDKNLPKKVHLLLAGRNTADFKPKLERDLTLLKNMNDFVEFLKKLS